MLAASPSGGSNERVTQHRLIIFPPKIARSREADTWLDGLGRLSGPSPPRAESWSLYHGDECIATRPIGVRIPVQFNDPGFKTLVARVVPPPIGSMYLVQSQLLVVPSENEELDWLVRHPIEDESIRWFAAMMKRHREELGWKSEFDQSLRRYIAGARDPLNEEARKMAERARFLAFSLHQNLLRKIARQFFQGDESAIEEAVHVTSIKFLTCQGNFDPSRSCGGYLGKAIRNYCIDQKLKRNREGTMDGSQLSNVQDTFSPFELSEEAEHQQFLLEELNRAREEGILTEGDFAIFCKRAVDKMPFDKIAEAFQLTASQEYQGRYAAGQRRVAEILTKIRRYMTSSVNRRGE